MMLHTVNKSPFERNSLETCLRLAKSGSSVILIEDGVYGAKKGSRLADTMNKACGELRLYVLGPDLEARGISTDSIIENVKVVDYAGFVDLAAECDAVNAWL